MNRRDFIAVLSGVATWPLTVNAQNRKPTVGVLWHAGSAQEEEVYLSVVQKAFHDLGYVEGRNIAFLHRFPAETPALFERFAKDLVDRKVDAIIAVTGRSAREVKRATNTIPTVFVVVPDPIGAGLVDSLARPGGNLTGLSLIGIDLSGKRLELLKEAMGSLTRVGLLADLIEPAAQSFLTASRKLRRPLAFRPWFRRLPPRTTLPGPSRGSGRMVSMPQSSGRDPCCSTSGRGSGTWPSRTSSRSSSMSPRCSRTVP